MTKKKVILLVVAALFAVSGLTALPSGNITGGVGCIVIAAVCAYFGLKKKSGQRYITATRTAVGSVAQMR